MNDPKKPLDLKNLPTALCRRLVLLRYTLPLLSLVIFLVSGLCHSVYATEGGEALWVSPIALCFNTLKNARGHYLGGATSNGTLYGLLMAGAVIAVLCFVAALALSVFSLSQLYIAATATDKAVARRAKIRHKTVFPSRVCLLLLYLPLLVSALFPAYVSMLGKRFIGESGALLIKCNIPLILLLLLFAATLFLSHILAPQEKDCGLDMFDTEEQANDEQQDPEQN